MTKIKNKKIHLDDLEKLRTIQEEYRDAGFDTSLKGHTLTVFALRRKKPKKKKAHHDRDKRREKFAKRDV